MTKTCLLALIAFFCSPVVHAAMTPAQIVKAYYEAYNSKNLDKQSALMADDVVYEPNQGQKMTGSAKYRAYVEETFKSVDEKCMDVVTFSSPKSKKIIAESYAVGKYIKDIDGYPKAHNQPYRTHVIEVFEFSGSKIKSLSTHYNDKDWTAQISK